MRRSVLLIAALIVLDQGCKLLISGFFFDKSAVLIPAVLSFKPVINTNLTWIASMAGFHMPVALMLFLQIVFLVLAVLVRRYCIYLLHSARNLSEGAFSLLAAGVGLFIY